MKIINKAIETITDKKSSEYKTSLGALKFARWILSRPNFEVFNTGQLQDKLKRLI